MSYIVSCQFLFLELALLMSQEISNGLSFFSRDCRKKGFCVYFEAGLKGEQKLKHSHLVKAGLSSNGKQQSIVPAGEVNI